MIRTDRYAVVHEAAALGAQAANRVAREQRLTQERVERATRDRLAAYRGARLLALAERMVRHG